MFGIEALQLWLGIQGVVQTLIAVALWMIVFVRLGYGALGAVFALFPLIGLLISPVVIAFGTLFLGTTTDPTLLYTVVPGFVSFVFAVAPLAFLVAKLKPTSAGDVFK